MENGKELLKSSTAVDTTKYHLCPTMTQTIKDLSKTKPQVEEQLFDVIGSYGPWQRRVFILIFLVNIIGVWQNFAITFLAPNMQYWCVSHNTSTLFTSITDGNSTNELDGTVNHCEVPVLGGNATGVGQQHVAEKLPCTEWEYNLTFHSHTLVSEFNLVCDREWMISFAKSMYMIGFMFSVIIFGQISDCFGRLPTIISCYFITLVSSLLSPFSISYTMFIILRFFQAFGRTGLSTTGFVLLMEIIGPKWRTELGVLIQVGWCIGFVILPAIAWFVRNHFWLQLALALPIIPLGCLCWIIPESPRWLMTRRKREQFEKVISQAIKINGVEIKDDVKNLLPFEPLEEGIENNAKTMVDLLKTPNLRKYTLNMMSLWLVNAYVYYSLSYNTNDLGGDPYLNFLLSGFMEILSYILVFFTIRSWGRKPPVVGGMIIGGIACAAIMAVPSDLLWLSITFSMIGKLCITGTFGILYVYTSELFPTVVRNVALGSCSTCARVGSIMAPFVRELGRATHPTVPNAVNAVLVIISGLFGLLLPETKDNTIPDTLEEAENKFAQKKDHQSVEL